MPIAESEFSLRMHGTFVRGVEFDAFWLGVVPRIEKVTGCPDDENEVDKLH